MKNKDKAIEIAKKHMPFCGLPITECIDATLEMAEHKDEQFQKVLDYVEICYGVFSFGERDRFLKHIKEIYYGE